MSVLRGWFAALRAEGISEQDAVRLIAQRIDEPVWETHRLLVEQARVKLGADDVGRSAPKKHAAGDHARGERGRDKGRGGVENRGARRRAAVTDIERDLRDA